MELLKKNIISVLFYISSCCLYANDFNPFKMDLPYSDTILLNEYSLLRNEKINYNIFKYKENGIDFYSTWKGREINKNTIINCDSIKSLVIENKRSIPTDIVKFKNIEYLSIESIDTIDFNIINNLKNLKFLKIDEFEYIRGNINKDKNLIFLYLNTNNQKQFYLPNSFYKISSLKVLRVLGNFILDNRINNLKSINEISISSFSKITKINLPSLKMLSICAYDSISSIKNDVFFLNNNIETLLFNGLKNSWNFEFKKFNNLKYLSIEDCKLPVSITIEKSDKIKILMLKRNLLTEIPFFICNFPNTEFLDLSLNEISKIDAKINCLKKLNKLNFYGNVIDSISNDIKLEYLEGLSLGDNLLKAFPKIDIPKIKKIYLWRNDFDEIPKWFYELKDCEISLEDNNIIKESKSPNIIIRR